MRYWKDALVILVVSLASVFLVACGKRETPQQVTCKVQQ